MLDPDCNKLDFTHKLRSECKIFGNVSFILDKIESDGYLESVRDTFGSIFSQEMSFAVSGSGDQSSKKSRRRAPSSTCRTS